MKSRSVFVVSLAAMALAAPALAGLPHGVFANAQTAIPSGPDDAQYNSGLTGPVSSSARSDDIIGLSTFSIATAAASFGDLHAYGFSNGGVSGILQNAAGEAGWFDQITVSGSGQVLMFYMFAMDGTLDQSLPGPFSPASVGTLAANVGAASDFVSFTQHASPTPTTVSTMVTLGPFLMGTNVPTNVMFRLIATVNGVGEADFSSTAHYVGATVTDLSGAPLNATVTSDSGFNYIVPSPGVLSLAACSVLAARRRRR